MKSTLDIIIYYFVALALFKEAFTLPQLSISGVVICYLISLNIGLDIYFSNESSKKKWRARQNQKP